MSENLKDILLIIHVSAGALALLAGLVAMILSKGDKGHRLAGKVYFWSMTVVVVLAIIMSLTKFNAFLLIVAIFSFQLMLSGYRSINQKQVHRKAIPKGEIVLLVLVGIVDLGLVAFGVALLVVQQYFGFAPLAFGLVGLFFVRTGYLKFVQPPVDKKHWLYSHIAGMIGSYIAAFTAFMVTLNLFEVAVLNWILPTIIGSPVIAIWIRKYKNRR